MTASNPFDSREAIEQSNYCLFDGARVVRADTGLPAPDLTAFVHDGFRALALNDHFPCVGAKSAVRHAGYRFGLYRALGDPPSIAGLARDLFTFTREDSLRSEFTTYVASFAEPPALDEAQFEALLWGTLQALHDLDAPFHEWDARARADAADPHFSFSFAGTAFFVVGLHASSSRVTRRFAWPTLAFNPHRQFERLKDSDRFGRFRAVIREADRELQGDVNPMLADFGERSEAAQYSGRQVGPDWQCPFHAHPADAQRPTRE